MPRDENGAEEAKANDASASLEESFHNTFLYFVEALGVLSLDAKSQRAAMGNFNVAWEIQHDVLDFGMALVNWPESYLLPAEKETIELLLEAVKGIPPEALLGDNEVAMNHESWAALRRASANLLEELSNAIGRNEAFLRNDGSK